MNTDFFKINQQCLQNIMEATNALSQIETKGDSTMMMYKIRLLLSASLEQIQKDNEEEEQEEGIVVSNIQNESEEELEND